MLGRPTDYDPSYCEQVIEWGRAGKSRTWMAAQLGIARSTIYEWEKQHADFSDALARAKALEQSWWEDAGQMGIVTQGFCQSVWSRSMAARFPDDWRETTRQEQTGPEGGPIEHKHIGLDEFESRIARLAARARTSSL